MELSIVIPVFNEEKNIELIHSEIRKVLVDVVDTWEIIFVNDGSKDNSMKVLRSLCKEFDNIRFICLTRNFGQQAAFTAGLDHAKGDAVITMDCDLQDPPSVIPEMINKWKEGSEIVYARRRNRKDGFFKKYSALLYYKLLTRFSDIKINGNIGDFRLIDRKVMDELSGMREKARYLRGMVFWLGFDYSIVDYDRPERKEGNTGFSLLKMTRLGMTGILNFSLLPLRAGLIIGSVTVLLGVIFLIYITCDSIFYDKVYPLYKWLSVITFVFVGLLFILIWILGEYIGKIYTESKDRPIYIIHNKENFSK